MAAAKHGQQMENDTVVQDKISRTMYGFCYQESNGVIKNTINAQLGKCMNAVVRLDNPEN